MTSTTRTRGNGADFSRAGRHGTGGDASRRCAEARGTLRTSAPANPSSLDPATAAGSDHAFLFTMYDTLTEWDLKP